MHFQCVALLSFAVALGACGSKSSKSKDPAPTGRTVNSGSVVIKDSSALTLADPQADFVFSLDTTGAWQWNVAEQDLMEYSFFISFSVDGQNYEVGYSNFSHGEAGSGTFQELISGKGHGQLDFWQEEQDGSWSVVDVGAIEAAVTSNSLTLKIGPNPLFAAMKAQNIKAAKLTVDGELIESSSKSVVIEYK
jgi:hypothetical protein